MVQGLLDVVLGVACLRVVSCGVRPHQSVDDLLDVHLSHVALSHHCSDVTDDLSHLVVSFINLF